MSFLYSVSHRVARGGLKEFQYGRLVRTTDKMDTDEDSLKAWMMYIFPEEDVRINTTVPRTIQARRNGNIIQDIRVTCRIERLSLIVELDTIKMYQNPYEIKKSRERDAYLEELGYQVVHIPYWVQLSTDAINHYFHIVVPQGCSDPSGFRFRCEDDFYLTPANFCTEGVRRFVAQLERLPSSIRNEVLKSMQVAVERKLGDLMVPIGATNSDFVLWKMLQSYSAMEDKDG